MKGKVLRFIAAAAIIPVILSSVLLAKNVRAASDQTYDGTIKTYKYTEKVNLGKYFEPAKDGKYQAMIYFHGGPENVGECGLRDLPERLNRSLNRWTDMGYCDPMVVITPQITNYKSRWGITDFEEFISKGYFKVLLDDVKSGKFSDKIDTGKPILVAGYSMGGSETLYAATKYPDDIYNIGAFSSSWCFYQDNNGYCKESEIAFSKRSDGHFFLSVGEGEAASMMDSYNRYLNVTENNGKNIKNRFKSRPYSADFGGHTWMVFEMGTFDFLYYYKFNSLPGLETLYNACWGNVKISGTTTVGSTLTATCSGYYTDTFRYQWYRVNASTGEQTAISGATGKSYTLTSADAGYKIRCRVKDTDRGNDTKYGYSYRTTGVISPETKPALSGSVNVSGYYRCYQPLDATAVNCPASNLNYQWKRNGANISGAVHSRYTLTKEDIDTNVVCVITDKDGKYTGSISSTETKVKKGFGPDIPDVTGVDCSYEGASDGKILNVNSTMEYAKDSQDGPYTSCTGTSVTGLSKGTYYVRVKETETTAVGAMATVKIGEKSGLTPTNTNTPTPAPTSKPESTNTPTPTSVPQNTTEPTQTPIPTDTPVPTESAGGSPTPLPTSDPSSIVTPTPTPAVTQGTEPTSTPTTAPGNTATATPTAAGTGTPAPTAATSVTATPSDTVDKSTDDTAGDPTLEKIEISEIKNAKKGVSLKWKASSDAKSVNILKSTDGKKFTLAATVDAKVTSYTDKKTANGKTYTYKIEAVNGKLWSQSEVVSICRLNTVKVKKKSSSKGSAYLKWKKNPKASGYQIRYVLNGKVKTVNVKSAKKISRTIKKLKSKKKYVFSVRAYKKAGQINYYGDWSKTYKIKIK